MTNESSKDDFLDGIVSRRTEEEQRLESEEAAAERGRIEQSARFNKLLTDIVEPVLRDYLGKLTARGFAASLMDTTTRYVQPQRSLTVSATDDVRGGHIQFITTQGFHGIEPSWWFGSDRQNQVTQILMAGDSVTAAEVDKHMRRFLEGALLRPQRGQ